MKKMQIYTKHTKAATQLKFSFAPRYKHTHTGTMIDFDLIINDRLKHT